MIRESLLERLERQRTRHDWPSRADLEAGHVQVATDIRTRVFSHLEAHRHCILTGPEGRGKTTTARFIGHKLGLREGSIVYHYDCSEPGGDTIEQLAYTFARLDASRPYYVVENLHDLDDDVESLLFAAARTRESTFLWTARQITSAARESLLLGIGSDADHTVEVRLEPDAESIRTIVERYRARRSDELPTATAHDIAEMLVKTGGNLRLLRAYLEAWSSGSLPEIPEDAMLRHAYAERLSKVPFDLHYSLARIATVNQYGVAVPLSLIADADARALIGTRIIAQVGAHLTFAHSSDARVSLKSWAVVNRRDAHLETVITLREFLKMQPYDASHRLLLKGLSADSASVIESVAMDEAVQDRIGAHLREVIGRANCRRVLAHLALHRITTLATTVRTVVTSIPPVGWADKIRTSGTLDYVGKLLRLLKTLDRDTFTKVLGELTQSDWRIVWRRSRMHALVDFMYPIAISSAHPKRENARIALDELASSDEFPERLMRLSIRSIGKALIIWRELGTTTLPYVAKCVAERLPLDSSVDPKHVGFVLRNLATGKYPEGHLLLIRRIVAQVRPARIAEDLTGDAIRDILSSLAVVRATDVLAASEVGYIETLLLHSNCRQPPWDAATTSHVLRHLADIDNDLAKTWASTIGPNLLLDKAKAADCLAAFYLVKNLAVVDSQAASRLAAQLARSAWPTGMARVATAAELAHATLCSQLGGLNVTLVPSCELHDLAAMILEPMQKAVTVFSILGVQRISQPHALRIVAALGAKLTDQGLAMPLADYLSTRTDGSTDRLLAQAVLGFPSTSLRG